MPRRSGSKAAAATTPARPKRRSVGGRDLAGGRQRCQDERRLLAYESARILAEHGPTGFDRARRKAAARLGISDKRCWPDNGEINDALIEQQRLFEPGERDRNLADLRRHALQAMREFAAFRPRLIGSALRGTATREHGIELRLFADSPEEVLLELMERRIPWRQRDEPQRYASGSVQAHPVFEFVAGDIPVHLQVLPWQAQRQPPLDPVSERPERGIDADELLALLADDAPPQAPATLP
ncbi:MAG: hypothetical protein LJE69_01955 [Thiohalocapsa sp.]|jgi:hypothetical protein|uniref:hypothetical protein n=1 Tax=Thiohalocapsa sp. TaxID=2497641 RepID=UPI0025CC89C6|nr:hypothetical protein [Thiohalocapsa sp.]MCG6939998.1 hypothetical protein [Thiohalocapsa sp.]